MHFMSQPRYNPKTQRDDWYYRIKESFRDLTGRVRSRVMLNVGFIDEPHHPEDIRDIGKCLTYIHEHQGEKDLFGNPLSRYNEFVQRKAQEFWHEMVNNGSIDAVKATMEESRKKAERLVDVNTIQHTDAREIECTNRQLKTDLNLRPIHHKKDDRSDAHLFLGLLAYWIVNTIRYKLKQTGETCFWTEIVRRLSTQKAVTTEATNALGEKVHMRLCSEPNKSADDIYERLKYKKMPFRKIRIEKSL